MSLICFSHGLVLARGQRQLKFHRALDTFHCQFEYQDNGEFITLKKSAVLKQLERKELRLVCTEFELPPDHTEDKDSPDLYVDLMSMTEDEKKEFNFKLGVVKALRKRRITKGQREEIKNKIAEIAQSVDASMKVPKASAVMEWARSYEASDENPYILAPRRRRRSHQSIISDFTKDLVSRAIRKVYLNRQRNSAKKVHDYVEALIKRLQKADRVPDLDGRRLSVSERTIHREIGKLDKYEVARARYGDTRARNLFRHSFGTEVAEFPLQRVEEDHTELNIYVIDDVLGIPLGRPWLTVIVDRYSGYILGFYISFAGPSIQSALGAVKCSIRPKDEILAAAGEVRHPWLAEGIAALYVFDNGLEFQSPLFRAVIEHALRSEYIFCKVRSPWLKPSVERAIHEMNESLPRVGFVHKMESWSDYDPRRHAAVTFSNLCKAIVRWVCDIYPQEMRKRTLTCPFDRFMDGLSFAPIPQFTFDYSQLDLIAGIRRSCTVGTEGVQFEYQHYHSDELVALTRSLGPTFKTYFKYNPEDLGAVFVQHPRDQTWLLVPNTRPDYADGLSLYQHKQIRRFRKEKFDERHDADAMIEARMAYAELLESISIKPSKKSSAVAAKFANLTSARAFRGEAQTIQTPVRPPVTREELLGSDHSVPDYTVTCA